MQHRIPVASLGPDGAAMRPALEACVHCGFCLPRVQPIGYSAKKWTRRADASSS